MTTLDTEHTADADARLGGLRQRVVARTARLLAAAAINPTDVTCIVEGDAATVRVLLELPVVVGTGLAHALGVRVLDAVHASGLTFGRVDVVVRSPAGKE